jgi:hypothetical protein
MSFLNISHFSIPLFLIFGTVFCTLLIPSQLGQFPLRVAALILVCIVGYCIWYTRLRAQFDLPFWGYSVGVVLFPPLLLLIRQWGMKGA